MCSSLQRRGAGFGKERAHRRPRHMRVRYIEWNLTLGHKVCGESRESLRSVAQRAPLRREHRFLVWPRRAERLRPRKCLRNKPSFPATARGRPSMRSNQPQRFCGFNSSCWSGLCVSARSTPTPACCNPLVAATCLPACLACLPHPLLSPSVPFSGSAVVRCRPQFVYCLLVGSFPFNSFLAGFSSTVGAFVLTGTRDSSRSSWYPDSTED